MIMIRIELDYDASPRVLAQYLLTELGLERVM
jgi:hypothetical protein